jgi:predicted DNA-binding protein
MTTQATRNLHVPLPDPMYRRLRIEAQRSNRPATDIAREAIDTWLAEKQRIFVHESVAAYALEAAGSPADLDEQLEAAGIESLLAIDAGATEEPHE